MMETETMTKSNSSSSAMLQKELGQTDEQSKLGLKVMTPSPEVEDAKGTVLPGREKKAKLVK
jgi:hypothetical protein